MTQKQGRRIGDLEEECTFVRSGKEDVEVLLWKSRIGRTVGGEIGLR